MEKHSDAAISAGRGVIWITAAKLYFIIGGYAIFFILPRIFDPSLFGVYSLVVMAVSFIDNAIITGTIQAVSRFTTRGDEHVEGAKRTGLKVQGLLGLGIAAVYALGAGPIATHLLGSPGLAPYMRLSSLIIVFYSCYAVFIGSFNGRRQFHKQAILDMTFTTLRAGAIVGFAAIGWGVGGAVGGFAAAAFLIMGIAAGVVGWHQPIDGPTGREYASFAFALMLYTLIVNLVLSIDLYFLQGMSSRAAIASGLAPDAAEKVSNALSGQYKAVQVFAFIPYQLIISVTFVVFPLVSRSTYLKDQEATRETVRQTMRFALVVIAGFAAVLSANPKPILALIYRSEYWAAAPALRILAWGIAAFGLMTVASTILNGAGLAREALLVATVTLILVCLFQLAFLSGAPADTQALTATAWASTAGMTLGLLISGGVLYRKLRAFWAWSSVIRTAIAVAAAMAVGILIPDRSKLMTLVECIAVFGVYVAVLAILREFKASELVFLKRLVGLKKAS